MTTLDDQTQATLLQQAIQLALGNVNQGREPFGSLVVLNGEVVGKGVNTGDQDLDPTAHAEVAAIRDACRHLGTVDLTGATVVSSCQPCAMCHVVCAVAEMSEVIYAAPRELVPDDGNPRDDLVNMQDTLRALDDQRVRHVPTPGAEEPFTRYVERMSAGS